MWMLSRANAHWSADIAIGRQAVTEDVELLKQALNLWARRGRHGGFMLPPRDCTVNPPSHSRSFVRSGC